MLMKEWFNYSNYIANVRTGGGRRMCLCVKEICSEIARFVHIADNSFDSYVADGFAEKELFDGRRGDGAQGRK